MTCKEQKKCDLCERDLEENQFSKSQWTRTRSGQRVCTACQKLQHGQWTCSVCNTRRLHTYFSSWRQTRAGGQDGRQKCNICLHIQRAHQRTNARLQRRRRKVAEAKVAKVLREVRAEIQEANAKKRRLSNEPPTAAERPATAEEPEEERQHRHAQALGRKQGSAKERKEYECPYCHAKTHSSVRTGKVQVAGHCGKQFRVRHGDVVRAFTHACPSCGTKVQSAKAPGRIQSKHQKPNGKACPTTEWVRK